MADETKHFYEFGPYRIDLEERLLFRGQEPIPLPPKAFETLLILVNRSERVVLKDDLMKNLWPDTFVEESNLSQNIFVLRKALGETAQDARYIATVPGRGYRFAQKVTEISAAEPAVVVESTSVQRVIVEQSESWQLSNGVSALRPAPERRRWIALAGALAVLLVALAIVFILRQRRSAPMSDADLVLVTDFVNTTGEPVFDGSLKQALAVKLAESPYFNVALDSATRQTLKLMQRSPDERVVPPLAREVCQREGAKVAVGGSITSLGSNYVLDLDAINCVNGDSVAHQEIEALSKDQVLTKLGEVIPPLRRKLGESLASIQKFNTPIEQATTKSLAALKAYTEGDLKRSHGEDAESIPLYKMAIELDPDFAIAYARLGALYTNLQETALSDEYLKKAFELRQHLSEREKLYVQAHYYVDSTGEIEKAIETYQLWTQIYPHDWIPFNNLSNEYNRIGEMEKAVEAGQQALRLNPNHSFPYNALARSYQRSSRWAEAKSICEKAEARKFDGWTTHEILWTVAFVEGDEAGIQRQVDWYKGNPMESWLAYQQASTELGFGQHRKSQADFERARNLAVQHEMKESAAEYTLDEGDEEAVVGNQERARALAAKALGMVSNSTYIKSYAALLLAHAGETQRSQGLIRELKQLGDSQDFYRKMTLTEAGADLALNQRDPASAVEQLQSLIPYDLASGNQGLSLYYRGLAYLELKQGKEAAEQFQKIVDNRGACWFYWPLAHLGLARAHALAGETEKSLEDYRNFLQLWKNADPDTPVFKQAKSEFAKLSGKLLSGVSR